MILTLTFAGATVCSAGDRANGAHPTPAVDAPMASTGSQQIAMYSQELLLSREWTACSAEVNPDGPSAVAKCDDLANFPCHRNFLFGSQKRHTPEALA